MGTRECRPANAKEFFATGSGAVEFLIVLRFFGCALLTVPDLCSDNSTMSKCSSVANQSTHQDIQYESPSEVWAATSEGDSV